MIRNDNYNNKGDLMSNIKLESVGTKVDESGMVFPLTTDTAYDGNETEGVHIMEVDNEWWETLECEEGVRLFQFLAKTKIYLEQDYFKWAQGQMAIVVESKGFVDITAARLHEGWSI